MARRRSPINSLPNEILENIFEIGARSPFPTEENYPRLPLFSKMPSFNLYPTIISQVCIRWREVALHMPVLWTFINLTRSLDSHRRLRSDIRRSLEWVPTYMVRSANLPLHITLDTTRLPVPAVIDLITPFSARWRSFTLLVSHVGNLPPILPLLVHTYVPRLRYLSITSDIYREGIVCYDPFVPFFVSSTPELGTIRLTGVYIAWNALPLANLQNLELHFTSRWPEFDELQAMFTASPLLKRLVVHDDLASILRHVNQPPSKPTIELPNLKHLEISPYRNRDERADVAGLMGLFSMSALEVLVLKELKLEEWISVTDSYELSRNAFDIPVPPKAKERYSYRRLPQSFPFLSVLVATSQTSSSRKIPPSSSRRSV